MVGLSERAKSLAESAKVTGSHAYVLIEFYLERFVVVVFCIIYSCCSSIRTVVVAIF